MCVCGKAPLYAILPPWDESLVDNMDEAARLGALSWVAVKKADLLVSMMENGLENQMADANSKVGLQGVRELQLGRQNMDA